MKKELKRFWDFLWHSNSVWSWLLNVVLAFILIKFILYPVVGLALGTSLPVVAVISESMEHSINKEIKSNNAIYMMCGKEFEKKYKVDYEMWWMICGEWYYKNINLDINDFKELPFSDGFNKGDIMILVGKKPEKIEIGDVIVFQPHTESKSLGYPIIHRVVAIQEDEGEITFETKGDNNPSQIKTLYVDETNIKPSEVLGVAKVRLPYLGYIKIWFTELFGALR